MKIYEYTPLTLENSQTNISILDNLFNPQLKIVPEKPLFLTQQKLAFLITKKITIESYYIPS